jgi:hypothetical protein
MHRAAAIVLAIICTWLPLAPALSLSAGSDLPACCRRDGSHGCALKFLKLRSFAVKGVSIGQRCPSFPQKTIGAQERRAAGVRGPAFYAGLISHLTASPQTEAGYRISLLRSRQKRGPPLSL